MPRRTVPLAVLCVTVPFLAWLGFVVPLGGAASAAEAPWKLEQGELRVTVPLKPGGAFDATSRALSGRLTPAGVRPVRLSGEISLDLATLETGISLRNQHLREKYLEVPRGRDFDRAVFSELAVSDASGPDFRGRSAFAGTLLLHGVSRPVTGTVEIRDSGRGVRVDTSFPLTLTDFGIQPPEYLGVGVANKVIVKVQLVLAPSREASP